MAGDHTNQPSSSSLRGDDGSLVLMGRFGAPHGIRGDIKLTSFASDPLALLRYEGLRFDDGRELSFTHMRLIRDNLCIAHIKGIDQRDQAQALTGRDIFIKRADLPPPQPDEFYITDLIGLEARDEQGHVLGHIRDVVNYGAGDILEMTRVDGEVVLIAFTRAHVPHVDCASGFVTVLVPVDVNGEPEP